MTDNSKKDGVAWFKQLQKEKHDADVEKIEKASAKPEGEQTGEEFLALHRLKAADRRKHFVEKFKSKNEH